MKLGMIGLGRMGGNMARRLFDGGHEVVAFDRDAKAVADAAAHGAAPAASLAEVAAQLGSPAIYWIMLPAGPITEGVMKEIAAIAQAGDIVIDGGNSFWKHDLEHCKMLATRGLHFVDVGVSEVAEVRLAYAIGVAEPVAIHVDIDDRDGQQAPTLAIDSQLFTPLSLIDRLELRAPRFEATARLGHFGTPQAWERTLTREQLFGNSEHG